MIPLTFAAYLLFLAIVNWLNKGPVLSLEAALQRMSEIRLIPFYYHYYTTESAAMSSLFAVVIMFVPIGIQYWIWRVTRLREFLTRGAINAGLIGGAISMALEFGKLFFGGARPDPTNVLIGAMAAGTAFLGASVCTKSSLQIGLTESDGSTA
jgi:hypothetical protein